MRAFERLLHGAEGRDVSRSVTPENDTGNPADLQATRAARCVPPRPLTPDRAAFPHPTSLCASAHRSTAAAPLLVWLVGLVVPAIHAEFDDDGISCARETHVRCPECSRKATADAA
jgi:hypothetical protein